MTTRRAVLFDFGNVIAFFDHMIACERLARRTGGRYTPAQVHERLFLAGVERGFDCGDIDPDAFLCALRSEHFIDGADEELALDWSDIFRLNEPVAEVIRRIPREVRVVLASNTNVLHHRHYRGKFADVFARFDAEVVSYAPDVRCQKPDERFYRACLKAAGCDASEVLYFDDRPDLIEAASRLGIGGVVYHPGVDMAAELARRGVGLG